ncbi:MAG: glycosyltransferase [Gemmatimonadaceae bacterium]
MSGRSAAPIDLLHQPTPRFSVVVPTFDRPSQLAACVAALELMERPGGALEIVVVNDGGAPPPPELTVRAANLGGSCELRLIEQRNAGPAAARNAGAAVARGELIAFTDDDCLPEPAWLSAFDAALRVAPDALLGGRTINAIGGSLYAEASQQLADFVASYFDGGTGGRFFTSNNIALARDAFLAIGGFDTRFASSAGEDRELCDRWSAQGRPSILVSEAIVCHAHALTAFRFLRQHFAYGRGAASFRRVRADSGRPVRVDAAFYLRSLTFPFGRGLGARAPAIAVLAMVAHAAYAAGLLWESTRNGARLARQR